MEKRECPKRIDREMFTNDFGVDFCERFPVVCDPRIGDDDVEMIGEFRDFSDGFFGICDDFEAQLDGVDGFGVLGNDFGEFAEFRGVSDGNENDDVGAFRELLDEREADTAVASCDKPILSHVCTVGVRKFLWNCN